MSDAIRLIATAADFAARRHAGQKRKGAAGAPYVNHLAEVACLVAAAGADAETVAAAWLHDAVEDGHAGPREIAAAFGARIADLVGELTDDMTLPSDERRRRQIAHAPELSSEAKLIKLADKLSNLRELAEDPPAGWDAAERRAYADWGLHVVDAGLRGVDAELEAAFDRAHAEILRKLNG